MDLGAPSSWLVAHAGLPVVAADDVEVGRVLHVLGDEGEDVFDGIVAETAAGQGFVDAEDVDSFFERGVRITLQSAEVPDLPRPAPAPGMLTATADTPPPGPLQRKLHRAWELVSGEG